MKKLSDYVKTGKFYESVVEDGSDIIFIVDFKGTILYHNDAAEELLGHKPKSLIDKNLFDFIKPDTKPTFNQTFEESSRKPYNDSIEFQFYCKDGSYKYLEYNSINLKQKEGLEGLILDCRDISQRKKDGEELFRAQKAKEQFLANISHEIRTPINGIAGMAELLSQNPTAEESTTYLHAIKTAADNLKVIINDILDLSAIESGKLKFEKIGFNIKDLLSSLIDTFQVQAREKRDPGYCRSRRSCEHHSSWRPGSVEPGVDQSHWQRDQVHAQRLHPHTLFRGKETSSQVRYAL